MKLLIPLLPRAGIRGGQRLNMKFIPSCMVLAALVALGPSTSSISAAEDEGVALAIIYDTSGSMKESVRDQTGRPAPKYVIANRALIEIAKQIQSFATNTTSGAPRKVHAGLFIFGGGGAKEAIKFGPFNPA